MTLQRIAVIGAGTMGSGIAQVLLQHGLEVLLHDAQPQARGRGLDAIERRLRRQVEKGEWQAADCDAALSRLKGIADLQAVREADLVIEAVPERLELKKQVFAALDQHARPGTVLASNTSGLDIAELAAATSCPENVVGMHFFNPPPLMPLVEVVRAEKTSAETFQLICALAQRLGKTPIPVANRPGFAVNRILFPMINEAIHALSEGVASAQDIDRAMQLGASHPLGPLALADFVGLDVTLDILESFEKRFGDPKYRPCPLLRQKVAQGELGRKTGRGFFAYE